MRDRTSKPKIKSYNKTRMFFWIILFTIIIVVLYAAFTPPSGYRNQCDNLPVSFTITERNGPVEVPVGTANIEFSANSSILHPFIVDQFGHTAYSQPQTYSGSVIPNSLKTIDDLKGVYVYGATHFLTTQFYRGSITTPTGVIPDSLFFVENSQIQSVNYLNCVQTLT